MNNELILNHKKTFPTPCYLEVTTTLNRASSTVSVGQLFILDVSGSASVHSVFICSSFLNYNMTTWKNTTIRHCISFASLFIYCGQFIEISDWDMAAAIFQVVCQMLNPLTVCFFISPFVTNSSNKTTQLGILHWQFRIAEEERNLSLLYRNTTYRQNIPFHRTTTTSDIHHPLTTKYMSTVATATAAGNRGNN